MTTKIIKHLLETVQLNLLKDLVGQELRFVGAENLDAYSLAESVVIATDSSNVKFSCGFTKGDFEGFDDEYPLFSAAKASKLQLEKIEKIGNFNVTFSKARITEISLLREVATCEVLGSPSWVLESDMGLVIHFGQGAISFVNITDYDIVCRLDFHSNFDASALQRTKSLQESDLVNTYEVSRVLVPLSEEVLEA
jgi:hypothetical protein